MSTFAVIRCRISEVWDHSNADRLQLAKVEGMNWQFCSQKGLYGVGADVIYFPVDSLLPDTLSEFLNVKPYLAGKDKNRIKTVKLRGQISQGLVIAVDTIKDYFVEQGDPHDIPVNLTRALGVVKYEPPSVECKGAVLKRLPDGVSAYDIEGADNYPEVVKVLMNRKVCITEKLEGTNFSITIMSDGDVMVNQRNFTIIPDGSGGEHTFWRVAKENGLIEKAQEIRERNFPGQQVTLRGELIGPGIQGNIYGLKSKEVFFFDILVDMTYVSVDTLVDVCSVYGLKSVPILVIGKTLGEWLDGRTLQEASNSRSILAETSREGIIIKPIQEGRHDEVGRLMIKQRSPEYLAKSKM